MRRDFRGQEKGRTIWIAHAHRDNGKRFTVIAEDQLTVFLELELAIRACDELPRQAAGILPKIPDMKTSVPSTLITIALFCFAVVQNTQAVSPAPDGGYPGGNTAEGQNALTSLTTGFYNNAVGIYALLSVTTGSFNTAEGAGALLANTANENTATGAGSLLSNTTGPQNTSNGAFALFSNTEGSFNTAIGGQALFSNTTGNINTAGGASSLFSNTTGTFNTAVGRNALFSNITGNLNTAIGFEALTNNTAGSNNTALGVGAGSAVTTASNVICIGANFDGADVNNSCFIGNIRDVTTQNADAIPVLIDSAGQLGTATGCCRGKPRSCDL